jgi:hypothetical protein
VLLNLHAHKSPGIVKMQSDSVSLEWNPKILYFSKFPVTPTLLVLHKDCKTFIGLKNRIHGI